MNRLKFMMKKQRSLSINSQEVEVPFLATTVVFFAANLIMKIPILLLQEVGMNVF